MTNDFKPAEGRPAPIESGASRDGLSATQRAHDLKAKVTEDLDAAREAIRQGADTATDKVKATITEQKDFAAHQVGGIAAALVKVGAELEQSDQRHVGRYAREIGSSVQSFAKRLEGKDLGEVATMAEEFGRKQPLAFLGVAALAGLAASRFLTASSHRTRTSPSNSPLSSSTFGNGESDNG